MNRSHQSQAIRLALAALSISMVSAACATAPRTSGVTGHGACVVTNPGTWSGPALVSFRLPGSTQSGYAIECALRSSDDRVSGRSRSTVNCDFTVDTTATIGACWGADTLTTDHASWQGTLLGIASWDVEQQIHTHTFDVAYLGTGEYEGLRYEVTMSGVDSDWTAVGTVESIG